MKRIEESVIRELVKPFTDDYGKTYAASRYIRVAQAQLEANREDMRKLFEVLADKFGYISEGELQALKEKYL